MKIAIKRYHNQQTSINSYDVALKSPTLLEALTYINENIDHTLTFNSGCRSSVCGSCAVSVNAKPQLACAYKIQEGDLIEPMRYFEVIKDLVVDHNPAQSTLISSKSYSEPTIPTPLVSQEKEKLNELQSDCILCGVCYSACPVFETNKDFLGPFALTRVWRYVSDDRDSAKQEKIDTIQSQGVWDCTLCAECTIACPQEISSKDDILKLRTKSAQAGYSDPNFSMGMNFGSSMF